MSTNKNNKLIELLNLKVYFPIYKGAVFRRKIGEVKAVNGITFDIRRGETLGLVGESGSGKTTTGNAIMQVEPPTGGQVFFDGEDITESSGSAARHLRRKMQMIFQDPFSSLNPRMKVGDIIGEGLTIHKLVSDRHEYRERVEELMETVGLRPTMAERYPHEFSGGQRQRIGIARALSLDPEFIVCDEPVSALDVSIQAQIINLVEDLQERFGLTYLFIAHDLAVVRHISTRIAVMYLGEIVEIADRQDLYSNPLHPYTQALLSAVPIPDPELEATRKHIPLTGEIPSPLNPPEGCPFHPRCIHARNECLEQKPVLKEAGPGHQVSCLLHGH